MNMTAISLIPLIFGIIALVFAIAIPIICLVILNKMHKTLEKIEEKMK